MLTFSLLIFNLLSLQSAKSLKRPIFVLKRANFYSTNLISSEKCLICLDRVSTGLDESELVSTSLDRSGSVWISLDQSRLD